MWTSFSSEFECGLYGNRLIHLCSSAFHLSASSLLRVYMTLIVPPSAATTFSPDYIFTPIYTPGIHRGSALPISRCLRGKHMMLSAYSNKVWLHLPSPQPLVWDATILPGFPHCDDVHCMCHHPSERRNVWGHLHSESCFKG